MDGTTLFQFSYLLICVHIAAAPGTILHRKKSFKTESQLVLRHIIKETTAQNIRRCAAACLRFGCCHIVNYQGETHRCILGNITGDSTPLELVRSEGWILLQEFPVEECVPNPCKNNGDCDAACIEGKETFSCQCTQGTFGRRCHIEQECNVALGMASTTIPDALVTASTSQDGNHLPHMARLNSPAASWTSASSDTKPWLKIELLVLTDVTGVVTQGAGQSGAGWVTKFKLSYSDIADGMTQVNYVDYSGKEKTFSGNKDVSSELNQFLDPVIRTRSLTFLMLEWNDKCSARVEVIGCYVEDTEWILAFKGRAETGLGIYDAWTSLSDEPTQDEADRTIDGSRHYRDSVIFHAWNTLPITEVKLTLHTLNPTEECLVMRFNGVGSDIKNWFQKSNILESPWTDLYPGSLHNHGTMDGVNTAFGYRRFLFDRCAYSTCAGDCGWLAVTDCAPSCACNWEGSLFGKTDLSKILYCKKTDVCNWNAAGDIGLADVMTIHIKF